MKNPIIRICEDHYRADQIQAILWNTPSNSKFSFTVALYGREYNREYTFRDEDEAHNVMAKAVHDWSLPRS
jgi:hypothetical protein